MSDRKQSNFVKFGHDQPNLILEFYVGFFWLDFFGWLVDWVFFSIVLHAYKMQQLLKTENETTNIRSIQVIPEHCKLNLFDFCFSNVLLQQITANSRFKI